MISLIFICFTKYILFSKYSYSVSYKEFCYKSIDQGSSKQLKIKSARDGQPPKYLKMEHSDHSHEGQNYFLIDLTNKIVTLYKRVEETCTSTVTIVGHGEKDLYFKFYSGKDEYPFYQFRCKISADGESNEYDVSGGTNFFNVLINLQRDSESPTESDSITSFTSDHAESETVPNNQIWFCTATSQRGYNIYFAYNDNQKSQFSDITSLDFFCDQEGSQENEHVHLSAWQCDFTSQQLSPLNSTFVYYSTCKENQLKVKTTNFEGQEHTYNFVLPGGDASGNDSIIIGNIGLQTWEQYNLTSKVNSRRILFNMKWTPQQGICYRKSGQFEGHKVTLYKKEGETDFIAYLWHIKPEKEIGSHVTSYLYIYTHDKTNCTFN